MNILRGFLSPEGRTYLYRVTVAVLVVLGAAGYISDEIYGPLLGLIAAVFAITVADSNVNKSDSDNNYKPRNAFKEGDDE